VSNSTVPAGPGNTQEPAQLERYLVADPDDVAELKRAGFDAVVWSAAKPPYLDKHCPTTFVSRCDEEGRQEAVAAVDRYKNLGVDVRLVVLRELGTIHGNLREWVAAGHDLGVELNHAGSPDQASAAPAGKGKSRKRRSDPWKRLAAKGDADDVVIGYKAATGIEEWDTTSHDGPKIKQVQVLIELADGAELFHSSDMRPFAKVAVPENAENGDADDIVVGAVADDVIIGYEVAPHHEVLPIKSQTFKSWLLVAYYQKTKSAPSGEALAMAIRTLEARACHEGREQKVYVRVGADEHCQFLDLCDQAWRVIEIKAGGWKVIDQSPIAFRRTSGMQPLVVPVAGGSIELLRQYVNVASDDDFKLLIVWLLSCLWPTKSYVPLILHGEQGSAKSTTSRVLRMLVDPHATPLRSEPKSLRDLMISAHSTWLLSFDNLSGIQSWLSDALCRLSTGGGFATRELYSNEEEVHFNATRPILLNGIDDVAERPDLLDRAIVLCLPPIPPEKRQEDSKLWTKLEAERGLILGALLDALAGATELLPGIELNSLPRMADFARFGEAVGRSLGWGDGAFMSVYESNIAGATVSAADASPVVMAIEKFIATQENGTWTGVLTDLLGDLTGLISEHESRGKNWPTTAHKLSSDLKRLAPILRRLDIHFTRAETRTNKGRKITIWKGPLPPPPPVPATPSQPSQQSLGFENKAFSSDGMGDGRVTAHPGAYATGTHQSPRSRRPNSFSSNSLHGPSDGSDGSDGVAGALNGERAPSRRKRVEIP
jgi:hypothetical protein